MSEKETLLVNLSFKDLFAPLIEKVSKDAGFHLTYPSHVYVVSLLESYMLTETLFSKNEETGSYDEPMLIEQFLTALQEEEVFKKKQALKSLGDSILFKSGFFADSLKRKLVGLKHHINIGAAAYGNLYKDSKNPIYEDLSVRFSGYVDLFSEIGQKVNFTQEEDLVVLFDRYLETDSKQAHKTLIEKGVSVPIAVKKVSNQ